MFRSFVLVLALFAALAAFGQSAASVRFVPPNPDSDTPVIARIGGLWSDNGFPRCADVFRPDANTILINLRCMPENATLPVVSPWSLDVVLGTLPAGEYDVAVRFQAGGIVPTPSEIRTHLIVQDGDAAFTVTPNTWYGPPPETIVLKGDALRCNDAALCIPATVHFGSMAATVVNQTGDEIHVQLPGCPPNGTHDVTVTRGLQTLRRAEGFHVFDPGNQPAAEFFTPVLFPVMSYSHGALGSIWETEASVYNGNNYRFINAYGALFNVACVICDPPPPPGVPPNQTQIIAASQFGLQGSLGYLLYVPREAAANLYFGLLVRDLSRQADALGAEVPVVREHEWYARPFALLNVPTDSRFRVALRVYSRAATTKLQIRIRPMSGSDTPLVHHPVITTASAGDEPRHGGVLISDLVAAYPALANRDPLLVEIIPNRPDDMLWALVSVTNNTTQHVTVISPQ